MVVSLHEPKEKEQNVAPHASSSYCNYRFSKEQKDRSNCKGNWWTRQSVCSNFEGEGACGKLNLLPPLMIEFNFQQLMPPLLRVKSLSLRGSKRRRRTSCITFIYKYVANHAAQRSLIAMGSWAKKEAQIGVFFCLKIL